MIIQKFSSLSFSLVYVHIPQVLTGILSLFHEWETVFCQVISILSISFWNIYIWSRTGGISPSSLGSALGYFYMCESFSLVFLFGLRFFPSFSHSASSTLRDFELKPKTHRVAPHPRSLQGLPYVIFWVPSPGRLNHTGHCGTQTRRREITITLWQLFALSMGYIRL